MACGEAETHTWALPAGAQRVEVLEPAPGQAVTDGFGDTRVATVRDVVTRAGTAVDVTVVGSDAACDGLGGAWLTTGVEFRARYHLVSEEPVLVSDDRHYYTRIETRFLSAVPREVRRQAKPPGTASCLRARPGG